MKKLILLGATGSIGTQTFDVVSNHSDMFRIVGMACGHNIDKLKEIIELSDCDYYNVAEQYDADSLSKLYPEKHFSYGNDGLLHLIELDADMVVNALVGFLGLIPSLHAIECKKDLALANKESLVVGGDLVKQYIDKYKVNLYPIDSEHSAIFQCLQGNKKEQLKKIVITASGGSLRNLNRDQLGEVTVDQALNHPNWKMGKRITIDSATMMNKGFEVIEAHYLFDIGYDQIDVLINTESVIHSMVEYIDKSYIAQMGTADMRLPIQYAINYPDRFDLISEDELDLANMGAIHFMKMDYERYPLLKLAFEAGKRGGNSGAIINAADETAVELFIEKKISFLEIEDLIFKAYKNIPYIKKVKLSDLVDTDKKTREYIYLEAKGV